MNIKYTISESSEREYAQVIRSRIKELKSNECDTESHIRYMAEKHAKKHECIDCILSLVHCELTFGHSCITVHMIANTAMQQSRTSWLKEQIVLLIL